MAGSSTYALRDTLVSTDWLAGALDRGEVRVFDCTCFLVPDPKTTLRAESGRPAYEEAHIPGAGFLDIMGDFSDSAGRFRFTMPAPERLAEVFGTHGIGDGVGRRSEEMARRGPSGRARGGVPAAGDPDPASPS